jgi:hypothetical protein
MSSDVVLRRVGVSNYSADLGVHKRPTVIPKFEHIDGVRRILLKISLKTARWSDRPAAVRRSYTFGKLLLYPLYVFGPDGNPSRWIDNRIAAFKLRRLEVGGVTVAPRDKQ